MESLFPWLGLIVILVVVALTIAARRGRKSAVRQPFSADTEQPESANHFPYLKKQYLLTQAERAFYETLTKAAGDQVRLFAKVRLSDLVYVAPGTKDRQTYNNRVLQKHVDFVLCSPATVSPVLAVELDDSSHRRDERKERDVFVDELFRTVGLPLVRIPVRTSYDLNELAQLIHKSMAGAAAPLS